VRVDDGGLSLSRHVDQARYRLRARGVGADDCSPLALVMHSNRPAHVVFDISGWFTGGAAPGFVPATPTRLIDTREALGPPPR
jgi:hypothetical protein